MSVIKIILAFVERETLYSAAQSTGQKTRILIDVFSNACSMYP